MEERLKLFLAMEGLSPSQFADKLGVQRSGVSHLLSGRNKPSFEFINKMLVAYPKLNPDWLIMGIGKAYRDMPGAESAPQPEPLQEPLPAPVEDLPDPDQFQAPLQETPVTTNEQSLFVEPKRPEQPFEPLENRVKSAATPPSSQKRIAQITIFYTDGTYEIR